MHFIHHIPFWYLLDVSVSSFLFQTPLHQNSFETLMDTLNGAQDGSSVRSRSPSRSLEVAPQHPPTTPIRVTESQELVITPDVVAPVDTSCPGCLAPTRRLKHTCMKARSENKRHTSTSVDSRHAKRSGTGSAPALTAPEAVQIPGASLAIDFGSDVGVRAGEMHVFSEAPSHISSSSQALNSSHLPEPLLVMEQGEASDVDGDVVTQVQIAWKGVGEYVDALTRALPWAGVWPSVGRR